MIVDPNLSTALLILALTLPTQAANRIETGFLNRSLMLDHEVFRYQVYVPAAYSPTSRWPVVLFLHGAGERGDDGLLQTEAGLGSAVRRKAAQWPAIIVFPQGRQAVPRWNAKEAAVALESLRLTEAEFATDPDRVYLTGMSRGGVGSYYLAYREPARFAAVLVACGRVRPPDSDESAIVPPADGEPFAALAHRLRGLPLWLFHGDADTIISVEESRCLAAALRALDAPFTYTEIPGGDHNAWDAMYQSPEVAAWLFKQRRLHPPADPAP
jgi:predicted peptidase